MDGKRILIYFVLAIIVAGTVLFFLYRLDKTTALERLDQTVGSSIARGSSKSVVHIYFADKNNAFLGSEERVLFHDDDPVEFGKVIIESLINGPEGEFMRTIPADTILRALYLTKDGTAYVDMSKEIKEKHPGGSRSELMTIYTIVNSLILNIPEIDAVKILIEGCESMTLAGHIDTRFPFKANMLLIR